MSVDEHAASLLTDEEREALSGDELNPEQRAVLQEIADDDDPDGDAEGEDEGDEEGEEGEKDDPDKAATAAKDEAAAAVTDDTAPAREAAREAAPDFVPQYKVALPADFEARVTKLKTDSDALVAQLKGGEIDVDQYNEQQSALLLERDRLNALRIKADIASEMASQTAEQRWHHTISTFMEQTAASGSYDYRKDAAKAADLDAFVIALANNEANNDKPQEWFLQEAHRRVQALHGDVATAAKAVAPNAKDAANAVRKPPTDAIPKTLANVPGGDGPGDVAAEFADLDGLDGLELEDAIARLTPAQRERWSNS